MPLPCYYCTARQLDFSVKPYGLLHKAVYVRNLSQAEDYGMVLPERGKFGTRQLPLKLFQLAYGARGTQHFRLSGHKRPSSCFFFVLSRRYERHHGEERRERESWRREIETHQKCFQGILSRFVPRSTPLLPPRTGVYFFKVGARF